MPRSEVAIGCVADFIDTWRQADPGEPLLHEAKRLLLNQLKASAEASQLPLGQRLLAQAAHTAPPGWRARLWWSPTLTTPALAAQVHTQLLGLLAFGDTHLPTLRNVTAGLLPGLLAQAEAGRQDGRRLLTALLVGLEVSVAVVAEAASSPEVDAMAHGLAAAAARCTLLSLGRAEAFEVLAEACKAWPPGVVAGEGAYEYLGSFNGLRGMALHCRPVPVAALAPVEGVLQLRAQAGNRRLQRLQLTLSPRAGQWAASDGQLAHRLATAWLLGQFNAEDEVRACPAPTLRLPLSAQVQWQVDARMSGVEACALHAEFADGGHDDLVIDAFLGAPNHPLSDSQLSELFRCAASDVVLPQRAGKILQAVWGLERAADVRGLLALLSPAA